MDTAQTATNIKDLCKQKGVSISALLSECNIRKSLIYDMEKRNCVPSAEILKKIANYFDVSVDYLLGKTDEHNASQKEPTTDDSLKKLHELVDKISKEYRDDAEEILELYVKKSMEKNNKKNTASISDSGIKHKD